VQTVQREVLVFAGAGARSSTDARGGSAARSGTDARGGADAGSSSDAAAVLDDFIRRLPPGAVVTQRLPPRLALVRLPAAAASPPEESAPHTGAPDGRRLPEEDEPRAGTGDVRRLPQVPGIGCFAAELPPDVEASLSPQEKLFVHAWRLRGTPDFVTKHRPGDGLPWDAPGFLPPDAPPTS
jgi:hypothetical protein